MSCITILVMFNYIYMYLLSIKNNVGNHLLCNICVLCQLKAHGVYRKVCCFVNNQGPHFVINRIIRMVVQTVILSTLV